MFGNGAEPAEPGASAEGAGPGAGAAGGGAPEPLEPPDAPSDEPPDASPDAPPDAPPAAADEPSKPVPPLVVIELSPFKTSAPGSGNSTFWFSLVVQPLPRLQVNMSGRELKAFSRLAS